MDLLFTHKQEKSDKRFNSKSECTLMLFGDDSNLELHALFQFDYNRYGTRKVMEFHHHLNLNILNGNINVIYKLITDNLVEDKMFRNSTLVKNNDFKMLFDLSENGFVRGEKRKGFWGVKYQRATDKIIDILIDKLSPRLKSENYRLKLYKEKYTINSLYDLIVDYHLDITNIKGHDGVYYDIQYDYPKKKYLNKNDNKFLPSVLDYYGIKSKYLISHLNKNFDKPIHISTLNYFCKLFGENYLEYIKNIPWEYHCFDLPPNKKTHTLRNESEKKCMISVINKWEKESLKSDSLIYSINKLLSIRDVLDKKGLNLKFKARNDSDFDNTLEIWSGYKIHFARGYRNRYTIDESFKNFIEDDINIDGVIYKPKLLLTEEEFRLEGYNMKNCMSKQFPHGILYLYVALQTGKKRINLQYRKGRLVQMYGKANTVVPENIFKNACDILTNRFEKIPDITWKKEKYDIITN